MDRKERLFIWITGVFVSALIIGDLIGSKFFRVGGIDLSVGMIPFPLTFILTDIVNEFYGTEGARRITFVGLAMAIFVFTIINIALALPISPESPMSQELFARSFGWSSRLYVASLTAYLIGQLLDIAIFQLFLRLTGHRFLWLRATGSTVFSQAVDSLVVNFVLLSGKKFHGLHSHGRPKRLHREARSRGRAHAAPLPGAWPVHSIPRAARLRGELQITRTHAQSVGMTRDHGGTSVGSWGGLAPRGSLSRPLPLPPSAGSLRSLSGRVTGSVVGLGILVGCSSGDANVANRMDGNGGGSPGASETSGSGGATSSGGTSSTGGATSSGGLASMGGTESTGGAVGLGGSAGSSGTAGATSCDPRQILCKRTVPTCQPEYVPSVDGACYGDCVLIDTCPCTSPDECPNTAQYTCNNGTHHCTPFL